MTIASFVDIFFIHIEVSWCPTCIQRQQAGRAGRRSRDSLAVFVADPFPIDEHYVDNPRELFEQRSDDLVIDLESKMLLEGKRQLKLVWEFLTKCFTTDSPSTMRWLWNAPVNWWWAVLRAFDEGSVWCSLDKRQGWMVICFVSVHNWCLIVIQVSPTPKISPISIKICCNSYGNSLEVTGKIYLIFFWRWHPRRKICCGRCFEDFNIHHRGSRNI